MAIQNLSPNMYCISSLFPRPLRISPNISMFSNQDISRRVKTQISHLEHTFGKNIKSLDAEGNSPAVQPQTRIKLEKSFQQSYLSENSKMEHSKSDFSASVVSAASIGDSKELKVLQKQLEEVRDRATREMIAAETGKCLVEMERNVAEYLEERLRRYAEKGRTTNNIAKNRGGSMEHLRKIAKDYLECSITYERNLQRLQESYQQ